ncbi:PEGA domain-containing protein, partial [Pyxidicoccus fallax]|uniref:PEGA domain-containing protein n=1 Tax=Pyxidicoccus fallax TaxID=394095 RepID=UPI0014943823
VPTLTAPRDTPVEVPAVDVDAQTGTVEAAPPTTTRGPFRTTADEAREQLAREEAVRAAKRMQQVRTLSITLFAIATGLLFLGLLYNFVFKPDPGSISVEHTTTLWVTSKPAGAQVKLNGKDVAGRTPLMVEGVIVGEANTLVLTLPGHLAWTRRFTPTSKMAEPVNAEMQPMTAPPLPPPAVVPVAVAATDGGAAVAVTGGDAGALAVADPDAGTSEAAGESAPDETKRAMHEVDYPTRLLVLRPMYNAAPIPEYTTATIDLNPGAAYSVWTQGNAALTEGRGTASGTVAYFLEGDLPADSSFGLLGASPRTLKGARKLHVFALDDNGPEDNSGSIRVNIRQSAYIPPRSLTFDAKEHALQLKPEHQVVLRGLNPRSTYLFTVRDDFAELRASPNGRVRQVLCVERGPDAGSVRATHRLLETGKRYQVTGTEDLRCTFPDSKVADNQGAIEIDLVDVTAMSRKERAEALKGSRRSER